jgi:hypothetical protein
MRQTEWEVVAIDKNCIKLTINEKVDLDGIKVRVLDDRRILMMAFTPTAHKFEWCIYTGNPMFVEIHDTDGVSVHYVEGSGKDYYISNN